MQKTATAEYSLNPVSDWSARHCMQFNQWPNKLDRKLIYSSWSIGAVNCVKQWICFNPISRFLLCWFYVTYIQVKKPLLVNYQNKAIKNRMTLEYYGVNKPRQFVFQSKCILTKISTWQWQLNKMSENIFV